MNDKFLQTLIDALSIEELEEILRKKKGIENKKRKATEKEKFIMDFDEWFKKRLYPPKKVL